MDKLSRCFGSCVHNVLRLSGGLNSKHSEPILNVYISKYFLSSRLYENVQVNKSKQNVSIIHNLTIETICASHVSSLHFRHSSTAPSQDLQVYHGQLTSQIRAVKLFSLTSSVGGIVALPILANEASRLDNVALVLGISTTLGVFTFLTPFMLHFITKKYVTELLYNPQTDKYTAIVYNFFLRRKLVTFHADQVTVPDVPGIFTTFKANGLSLFVDPSLFKEPAHYARIMGYDKPLDYKLNKVTEDKGGTDK